MTETIKEEQLMLCLSVCPQTVNSRSFIYYKKKNCSLLMRAITVVQRLETVMQCMLHFESYLSPKNIVFIDYLKHDTEKYDKMAKYTYQRQTFSFISLFTGNGLSRSSLKLGHLDGGTSLHNGRFSASVIPVNKPRGSIHASIFHLICVSFDYWISFCFTKTNENLINTGTFVSR